LLIFSSTFNSRTKEQSGGPTRNLVKEKHPSAPPTLPLPSLLTRHDRHGLTDSQSDRQTVE
jgi:hypothetical protein